MTSDLDALKPLLARVADGEMLGEDEADTLSSYPAAARLDNIAHQDIKQIVGLFKIFMIIIYMELQEQRRKVKKR